MKFTDIILYGVWIALPLFFFTLILWAKLERWGGSSRREDTGDLLRQGIFTTICVIIAFFIDQKYLVSIIAAVHLDGLPIWFFRIMLLPVVLFIAAKIIGPSKAIRITKARTVGQGNPKKRR
jgi:hypothetical protein